MANKKSTRHKSADRLYSDEPLSRGTIPPRRELLLFEPKTLLIIIISSVLTLAVAFFGEHGVKLLTSVISNVPEHAPFDGTVYPVQEVPNWVKLTETERKSAYSAIPRDKFIPTPSYNPSRLAISTQNLKWNDATDDAIRNEKITYSTPYLGSYRLDGLEGSGSHPAVDIKIPEGTPIYSIANGTVVKVDLGNGGFGKHIVIQHNNVPSLDDVNTKTTYLSSYSHLSNAVVTVNTVVTKGQLIGFSGMTGTSTTPHLHFQIDTNDASWHPYWPFTSADMQSAGVSFFEAINMGLKQSNAVAFSIHPLKYVQKYYGNSGVVAAAAPELIAALSQPVKDPYENISFVVQLPKGTTYAEGSEVDVTVQAFDEKGTLLSFPKFTDSVQVSLLNGNGTLNRTSLEAAVLRTGIARVVSIGSTKVGKEKVILRFRNHEFSSPDFEITAQRPAVKTFSVTPYKTSVQVNEALAVVIRPLNEAGATVTSDLQFEETPTVGMGMPLGSLSVTALSAAYFGNGESLITFTPTLAGQTDLFVTYRGQSFRSGVITVIDPTPVAPVAVVVEPEPVVTPPTPVVVVETPPAPPVSELVTEPVVETPVVPTVPVEPVVPPVVLPFSDVPESSEYFVALTSLKNDGLVAGYPDGTFRPEQSVTRAEAVTLVLRAVNEPIRNEIKALFPDVKAEDWFAPYVTTAFDSGFVQGNPDGTFRPATTVNLAEFFTMLFTALKTDIDPQIVMNLPTGIAATDWFAPVLQIAIQKGVLTVKDNTVDATKSLTRGEIALYMYRLHMLEIAQGQ